MSCHSNAQTQGPDSSGRRMRCGRMNWTPIELVAMILGFAMFPPIGLAILFWKFWRAKHESGDFGDFAERKWGEFEQRSGLRDLRRGRFNDWPRSSGNTAFDDWRKAEMERLAEERRKIFEAEQAFEDYLDGLRRAKDREDFERFMANRRQPEQPEPGQPPQS